MMDAKSLPHRKERGILPVSEQHLRPLHPARCFASRAGNGCQTSNLLVGHRQLDRLSPSCHDADSSFSQLQTRNPRTNHQFHGCQFHGIGRLGTGLFPRAHLLKTPMRLRQRQEEAQPQVSGPLTPSTIRGWRAVQSRPRLVHKRSSAEVWYESPAERGDFGSITSRERILATTLLAEAEELETNTLRVLLREFPRS